MSGRPVVRVAWAALVVAAGGCDDRPEGLSRGRAGVNTGGQVQEGVFSADGKAFLGWVTPRGKDPAEERRKPRPWVLWSTADGSEIARWTGDPIPKFEAPGSADGTVWPVHMSEPPKIPIRCRLLDLTTGKLHDVPGVNPATEDCTRPSFSADRGQLAYSDYAPDEDRRTARVYEKGADGWRRIAEVPGEKAVLSPDGKLVATLGRTADDRGKLAVRVFAVADRKERWTAVVDSYGLHGFTPDGRYVVQTDNAGHRLFDVATGKQAVLASNGTRGDSQGPGEVAYRDGWVAAVVRSGEKAELVRWDVRAGKEVSRTAVESPYGRNRTPPFGSPYLPVVRPIDTKPVAGRKGMFRETMTVDVYDPAAAEPVTRLVFGHSGEAIASPDGGTLAAIGYTSVSFHRLPAAK
ncbi:MAG TPA: hypothetical protein VM597_18850 [Gemmataceae bacterium]|nr:hypothetical protein [Gemmataceae bacterium]